MGSAGNAFGYEDGSVRRVGGALHMLVSEEVSAPKWVGMRLAHWTSASPRGDAPWQRVGTLVLDGREMVSSENCSDSRDHTAALWSPVAFFEDAEDAWFMTYIGYDCPGNEEGVVFLARSTVAGPDGIGGPYASVDGPGAPLLSRNGSATQPWEGAQGDDSFFAFRGPGGAAPPLLALYGSSDGGSYWSVGLASSPSGSVRGPWERAAAGNPLQINGQRTENPIVLAVTPPNALQPLLVAVFDDIAGEAEGFGLTWSLDGAAWAPAQRVAVPGGARAPMGLLDNGDGTLLVVMNVRGTYDSLYVASFAMGAPAPFDLADGTLLTTRKCVGSDGGAAQRLLARADGTLRLAADAAKCVDLFSCDTGAGVMDIYTCHVPGDGTVCGGAYPSNPPVNQLFDIARGDGTIRYSADARFCLTAASAEGAVQLLPCAPGDAAQQWAIVADGAGDGAVLVKRLGGAGDCLSVG